MRVRGLSSLVVAAMLAQDGAPARYARSRKGKKKRAPMTRTGNRERARRVRQIEAGQLRAENGLVEATR